MVGFPAVEYGLLENTLEGESVWGKPWVPAVVVSIHVRFPRLAGDMAAGDIRAFRTVIGTNGTGRLVLKWQ